MEENKNLNIVQEFTGKLNEYIDDQSLLLFSDFNHIPEEETISKLENHLENQIRPLMKSIESSENGSMIISRIEEEFVQIKDEFRDTIRKNNVEFKEFDADVLGHLKLQKLGTELAFHYEQYVLKETERIIQENEPVDADETIFNLLQHFDFLNQEFIKHNEYEEYEINDNPEMKLSFLLRKYTAAEVTIINFNAYKAIEEKILFFKV